MVKIQCTGLRPDSVFRFGEQVKECAICQFSKSFHPPPPLCILHHNNVYLDLLTQVGLWTLNVMRGRQKREKIGEKNKTVQITPTRTYCKRNKFTQHLRTAPPPERGDEQTGSVPGVCTYGYVPLSLLGKAVVRIGQKRIRYIYNKLYQYISTCTFKIIWVTPTL